MAARTGDADIGEAAFFLQAGKPVFGKGALVGEQALLPARQEDDVEFEPLGAVKRHQGDALRLAAAFGLHHQGDMLQKLLKRVEPGDLLHELAQILQPAGGVEPLVLPPHLPVAALFEDRVRKVCMGFAAEPDAPAVDGAAEARERLAGAGLQFFRLRPAGAPPGRKRNPLGAGEAVHRLQGGVADAAFRQVDDALEGEVVFGNSTARR